MCVSTLFSLEPYTHNSCFSKEGFLFCFSCCAYRCERPCFNYRLFEDDIPINWSDFSFAPFSPCALRALLQNLGTTLNLPERFMIERIHIMTWNLIRWTTVQITFIFIGQTRLVFGKRVCTCVMKHSNAFRTFLNWLKNSKRVLHEPKLHISRLPLFANFDLWSVSVWWV